MTTRRAAWMVAFLLVLAGLTLVVPASPFYLPRFFEGSGPQKDNASQLREALKSPEAKDRHKAIVDLGKLGVGAEDAVPDLAVVLVEDPDQQVRHMAAVVLSKMVPASRAAVPALAKALKDEEPQVRMWAAMALLKLRSEARAAIPALVEALKDERNQTNLKRFTFTVQELAALALGRASAGGVEGLPPLLAALNDAKTVGMTIATVRALGEVGPAARPAVSKLRALLEAESLDVRAVAAEALKKIAG